MAFPSNTPLVVTPEVTFAQLPLADNEPLLTILSNANGMYESYSPALLVGVYTVQRFIDPAVRSAIFEIPILPSADDLDYDFSHWVKAEAGGAGNLSIKVEEWTGAGWNVLENNAAIGAAADTMVRYNHTDAIDPNTTKLRITITRSVNTFTPCSILVRPGTNTVTTGIKTSGFTPFDDGLLSVGTADAGINTEHLNRGPQNAMSILRDRRTCVFSFIQELDINNALYKGTDGPLPETYHHRFGHAVGVLPFQVDPTVKVLAIGTVDGGATADLMTVYQANKNGVTLDCDGTIQSADLELELDSPGEINARASIGCDATFTAGQDVHIAAVVVLWRPGD